MDTRKSLPGAATPQQAERSKSNTPHAFPRLPYASSLSRRSSYGKQKPQPRPYAQQVQYYKLMRTLLRRGQACKERGLSQEIVSGLAGIGRTHLSAIERGERKPTLETFYRIGEALHMRPSAVLAEIEAELERNT